MHVLRHSAAKLRRDAGESIESVSQFLDHSNLATTTIYLRRLEGQTDQTWDKVAAASVSSGGGEESCRCHGVRATTGRTLC